MITSGDIRPANVRVELSTILLLCDNLNSFHVALVGTIVIPQVSWQQAMRTSCSALRNLTLGLSHNASSQSSVECSANIGCKHWRWARANIMKVMKPQFSFLLILQAGNSKSVSLSINDSPPPRPSQKHSGGKYHVDQFSRYLPSRQTCIANRFGQEGSAVIKKE